MKKTTIYLFVFILILVGICGYLMSNNKNEKDMIPSYSNGSGYRWKILKTENAITDSIWININVRDKSDGFIKYGIQVSSGCEKFKVENGRISLLLRRIDVESRFRASSVGYFVVETKPFFFQENDSVIIDFVLAEDDRPLINCE